MSDTTLPSSRTRFWDTEAPLCLESGGVLPRVRVAYRTWGRFDEARSDAVLVCHPLTASADVDLWWPGLLGAGRSLDPERDFVVCSNVLGSCYGTSGPASPRLGGSRAWGSEFPLVTVRDMVRLQARQLEALGVRRLSLVLGGSLGGLQALEWLALFPDRVDAAVVIAASARHSAWCIGWSEAQRQAIFADPKWRDGSYPPDDPPLRGLAAARAAAMVSYRSPASFARRFDREVRSPGLFQVESYLRRQGEKLAARFDPASYVALTRSMDSHDVGRGRGGVEAALGAISRPVLVIGIDSDVLYPLPEQEELARALPRGELSVLPSIHGHDGFLIDTEPLDRMIRSFRRSVDSGGSASPESEAARCAS